jgi:hypothetical protein
MFMHSVLPHRYGCDHFKDQVIQLNFGYNITGAIQPES